MAQKTKSKNKPKPKARSKAKTRTAPKAKAPSKTKAKAKPKTKIKAKTAQRAAPAVRALPRDLESRLLALALQMDKTMDALMLQALCEFADAWEDHYRTIASMNDEDDRIQLVVKPDET
jgi:hypothetical protein